MAVRAVNRVAGNRKTAQKDKQPVKDFKPTSADYDARIFAYREKDQAVSLTLRGREHIKLKLANYQIGKLKGRLPTSATLLKSRKGEYFVNIQIKDDSPQAISSNQVLGVDLDYVLLNINTGQQQQASFLLSVNISSYKI